MVTVYKGSIHEECIRYEHHSLVLFYLEQSQRHAANSMENHTEGRLQSDSIVAIVYAAMCIEAFINETAENNFPEEKIKDFDHLNGEFRQRGKSSKVIKKLSIIFKSIFDVDLPSTLAKSVQDLINLRNNLVHYKLSETATKIIYPPMQQTKASNGSVFTTVDFMQEPKAVIVPFVQQVTGMAAKQSFETAVSVLQFWNEQMEIRDASENNA